MNKKLVAVTPLWDKDKNSVWMIPGYLDGITAAGGVPIILTLKADWKDICSVLDMCDCLLITGGQDVSPSLYGETVSGKCGEICSERDEMEILLYRRAVELNKPVLGICRGIQLINVLNGGTLYQDILSDSKEKLNHIMKPPYNRVFHKVKIIKGTPLHSLMNADTIGVNSYHHQAIKRVGRNIEVMAVSEDGIVEAIRVKNKEFVWAVQWHPEFSYKTDARNLNIFKAFLHNI